MALAGSVIAGTGSALYDARMAQTIIRLLTLIAFVLMPIGMSSAPAMAHAPMGHRMAAGDASMEHCGDHQTPEKAPAPKKMDCTATCTALPASYAPTLAPAMKPMAPRAMAIAAPFAGIEPEIATPPPRTA